MFDKTIENLVNKSVQLQPSVSGVLTVWLDTPDRSVNVFNAAMLEGLEAAVDHIALKPERYRAVVFRSSKPGCFFVGADVTAIAAIREEVEVKSIVRRGQVLMDRVEALPIPTIAVVDGVCMGGGLEFALACDFRVASNSAKTKFGLPEIKLGLIPGWGGTQRLPRRIGLKRALAMILTGKTLDASKALEAGLVDHIIDTSGHSGKRLSVEIASVATREEPTLEGSTNTWDEQIKGFAERAATGKLACTTRRTRFKDWLLDGNWFGRRIVITMAARKILSQVKHYPALRDALHLVGQSVATGGQAFDAERDAFAKLLFTDTAQSLLGLFLARDQAKKLSAWVDVAAVEHESPEIRKVAVIGAGAMGAGIGALAACNGYTVVFKEIHAEAVESGRRRVTKILQTQVDRRRMKPAEMDLAVSNIHFTEDWKDIADSDLAIEAVLEIEAVKREVFEMLDRCLRPDAILVSNTSSLCVNRMPPAARREHTAGLHFFNPVDRMELVEIVRTESTSESTLWHLLGFVRSLGKTPIVTSDKPGFLVNRVLFPYLGEAVRMVSEGYEIPSLDQQMRRFGMPMGPLELIDQVGVDIASHVAHSLGTIQPESEVPTQLLAHMVERRWLGKKTNRGFYDYRNAAHQTPNRDVPSYAIAPRIGLDFRRDGMTDVQRRLVYPILNEAVHCLDEMVVTAPWMVDLGMVLGTGFAPMHGGPLRLIDQLGPDVVLHNMQVLAGAYGDRFVPADGLGRVVRRKEKFLSSSSDSLTWEKDHEPRYSTQS